MAKHIVPKMMMDQKEGTTISNVQDHVFTYYREDEFKRMIGLDTLAVKEAETQTKECDECADQSVILAMKIQSCNGTTSMNNLEGSQIKDNLEGTEQETLYQDDAERN